MAKSYSTREIIADYTGNPTPQKTGPAKLGHNPSWVKLVDWEKPKCVIGEYCRDHGFIHGAEAEELREKLSSIANRDADVRAVLDNVDARDSVAWLEVKERMESSEKVVRHPNKEDIARFCKANELASEPSKEPR